MELVRCLTQRRTQHWGARTHTETCALIRSLLLPEQQLTVALTVTLIVTVLPLLCSQEILPVVFQLLDDATDNVKGVSCYVLEMFCENLQPATVLPFLNPLMSRLVLVSCACIRSRLYHLYL